MMGDKVLFTASTFSHIRNFHLPYIRWFRERGWEVHVACGGKAEGMELADRTIELPFKKRMASADNLRAATVLRRLIRDGETGLLYPYGDSAACAKAIRTLMDLPSLRQSLGRAANTASGTYSLSNVFPTVTDLYAELTAKA